MSRWKKADVKKLQQLVGVGENVDAIADKLGRSVDAVRMKAHRLGLNVVVQGPRKSRTTTNELKLPEDLPSVEDQLRVLAATINELKTPGLDKSEVMRLRTIIDGVRAYKEHFADYVGYRDIEAKADKVIKELQQLEKESSGMERKKQ